MADTPLLNWEAQASPPDGRDPGLQSDRPVLEAGWGWPARRLCFSQHEGTMATKLMRGRFATTSATVKRLRGHRAFVLKSCLPLRRSKARMFAVSDPDKNASRMPVPKTDALGSYRPAATAFSTIVEAARGRAGLR